LHEVNGAAPIIIPIAVAIVTALGAYLASVRRLSGKIGTSEAEDLWVESASMREDYRGQLDLAQQRVQKLEARVDKLEDLNQLLSLDNRDLRSQLSDCQREVTQLKASP
jgi:chromosome segregation ATPase